jgi:hypothetical protein
LPAPEPEVHYPSGGPLTIETAPRLADHSWVGNERPRWKAEVGFRLAFERGGGAQPPRLRAVALPALAATVLLGAIAGYVMRGQSTPAPAPAEPLIAARSTMQAAAATPSRPRRESDVETTAARSAAVPVEPPVVAAASSEPVEARLAGVSLLGGARTATLRTETESFTIAEGEQLGDRQAARITAYGIELRDDAGRADLLKVGDSVPLE